jgi:lipopolysaccharide/colanic/teichoic acid biosynthesis glycosyltransferase
VTANNRHCGEEAGSVSIHPDTSLALFRKSFLLSSPNMIKRIVDLLVATTFLVTLLPVAVIIAIGSKLGSSGPAIYATGRVGKAGRIFAHYRFRTMAGRPPATTRFGRTIGDLTLDEIPGLWNVIRGDLSLIGPRAPKPEEVVRTETDWQKVLSIRPGLSGLGILTFLDVYNQTPVGERIKPDVYYVEHYSALLDIRLMAKTLYLLVKMGHLKGRL